MCRSPLNEGHAGLRLHVLASLIAQAQALLPDAVAEAREHGFYWSEIASELGTTTSAARHRYSRRSEHGGPRPSIPTEPPQQIEHARPRTHHPSNPTNTFHKPKETPLEPNPKPDPTNQPVTYRVRRCRELIKRANRWGQIKSSQWGHFYLTFPSWAAVRTFAVAARDKKPEPPRALPTSWRSFAPG